MQSLAGRLITVQEDERKCVARDLHDDLSQRLALQCVHLDLLRQTLPPDSALARELERLREDSDMLTLDVRYISHNLHHPQLALGLQQGSASFCHEFSEQHGIAIELTCEGDLKQIPETISIILFRLLQEALSNVAKHSGADRAAVLFLVNGDQATLRVTDRGRGFEIDRVQNERGLGLISMRERLRLVEGTLNLTSSPNNGTDILAIIPINIIAGATPPSGDA